MGIPLIVLKKLLLVIYLKGLQGKSVRFPARGAWYFWMWGQNKCIRAVPFEILWGRDGNRKINKREEKIWGRDGKNELGMGVGKIFPSAPSHTYVR